VLVLLRDEAPTSTESDQAEECEPVPVP
jgi:hypothetical protein